MKAQNGIWKISTGKGNTIYINCTDESKIMHPQELCKMNGLGMYGYEHLKDLAIAILRFEKEQLKHLDTDMQQALNELTESKVGNKPTKKRF